MLFPARWLVKRCRILGPTADTVDQNVQVNTFAGGSYIFAV